MRLMGKHIMLLVSQILGKVKTNLPGIFLDNMKCLDV